MCACDRINTQPLIIFTLHLFRELAAHCSFAVGAVNIFAKMCKKMEQRALHLASYRLGKFVQNITDKEAQMLLYPYASYLQCAINGDKMKTIPPLKLNDDDKEWDGNAVMGGYLGAQHTVDNKIEKYEKEADKMNIKFEQEWKKNKQSLFHAINNPKELPAAVIFYTICYFYIICNMYGYIRTFADVFYIKYLGILSSSKMWSRRD